MNFVKMNKGFRVIGVFESDADFKSYLAAKQIKTVPQIFLDTTAKAIKVFDGKKIEVYARPFSTKKKEKKQETLKSKT